MIAGIVHHLKRLLGDRGLRPGARRSGQWPAFRRHLLADHPDCVMCGRPATEVHHAEEPYHTNPARELDPKNCRCVCRRCHELGGHLDKWESLNPTFDRDAATWRRKIEARP
ncbi:MAG: hypothetical protein ABSG68_26720 [Thermoguttaceae bacterium]|jgi:hypothetical protein